MFDSFRKLLHVPVKPKERGVYAFTRFRKGEFLLYLGESKDDVYDFMQLPDRYKISFTKPEFEKGVAEKLLDFVEQIPVNVFEVSKANLEELQKTS